MALESFRIVNDKNHLEDVFFHREGVVAIESPVVRHPGTGSYPPRCVMYTTRRVHLSSGIYFDVVDDAVQFRRFGL